MIITAGIIQLLPLVVPGKCTRNLNKQRRPTVSLPNHTPGPTGHCHAEATRRKCGNNFSHLFLQFSSICESLKVCVCVCVCLCRESNPGTPNHTPLISICCSHLRVATKCFIAFCCAILLPCTPAGTGTGAAACLSVCVGVREKRRGV